METQKKTVTKKHAPNEHKMQNTQVTELHLHPMKSAEQAGQ